MAAPLKIAKRPTILKHEASHQGEHIQAHITSPSSPLAELTRALDTPNSRALVLRLESKLESFLQSPDQSLEVELPNGYQRMLVHRCAECYNIEHTAESQGGRRVVVLRKTPQSRPPSVGLGELVRSKEVEAPHRVREVKILARKDQATKQRPPERVAAAPAPPPRVTSPGPAEVAKTLEEREAEYARARARIFEDSESEASAAKSEQRSRDSKSAATDLEDPAQWQQEQHDHAHRQQAYPAFAGSAEGTGAYGTQGLAWGPAAGVPPYWPPQVMMGLGWAAANGVSPQMVPPAAHIAQTAYLAGYQPGVPSQASSELASSSRVRQGPGVLSQASSQLASSSRVRQGPVGEKSSRPAPSDWPTPKEATSEATTAAEAQDGQSEALHQNLHHRQQQAAWPLQQPLQQPLWQSQQQIWEHQQQQQLRLQQQLQEQQLRHQQHQQRHLQQQHQQLLQQALPLVGQGMFGFASCQAGQGQEFVGYGPASHNPSQRESLGQEQASSYGRPPARRRQLFDPSAPASSPPPAVPPASPSADYDVAVVPVATSSRSIPAAAMWSKTKAPVRVLTPPPQSAASDTPET